MKLNKITNTIAKVCLAYTAFNCASAYAVEINYAAKPSSTGLTQITHTDGVTYLVDAGYAGDSYTSQSDMALFNTGGVYSNNMVLGSVENIKEQRAYKFFTSDNSNNFSLDSFTIYRNTDTGAGVYELRIVGNDDSGTEFSETIAIPQGNSSETFTMTRGSHYTNSLWQNVDEVQFHFVNVFANPDQYDTRFLIHTVVAGTAVPANTAPNIDLNSGTSGNDNSLLFSEGSSAINIAPSASVTDNDADTITTITVALTNDQNGASEGLSVSAAAQNALGGISGASDITLQDTISITGASATVAQVTTFLQAITYNNTSATPNTTARTVSVVINDGTVNSVSRTATISVANITSASSAAAEFSTLNGINLSPAITFSSDNETLNISNAAHITGSTADGGGGTDTISVVTGSDLTGFTSLTGFETLTPYNNGSLTLSETQHDSFTTINGPGINQFTIASADGDKALTGDTDIESYVLGAAMTFTLGSAAQNVTGSTGDDIVDVAALTATGTLSGGTGTNTIRTSSGANISDATITDFESLTLASGASVTMTEAQHDSFTTFTAPGTETITISSATDGLTGNSAIETYVLSAPNTFTLGATGQNFTGSTGDDSLNVGSFAATGTLAGNGGTNTLSIGNGGSISGATVSGFENFAVASGGSASIAASQLAQFSGTVSGSGNETLAILGDGNFTTVSAIENYTLNDDSTNARTVSISAAGHSVTASSVTDAITFDIGTLAYTGTITGENSVADTLSMSSGANISNATISNVANLTLASGASVSMTASQHGNFTGTIIAPGSETITITGDGDFTTLTGIESYDVADDSTNTRTITVSSPTTSVTADSSTDAIIFAIGDSAYTGILTGNDSTPDKVQVTDGADISGGGFLNIGTLSLGSGATVAIDAANIGNFSTAITGSAGTETLKLMDGGSFDFTSTSVSAVEKVAIGTDNNATITLTDNFNANGQAVSVSNVSGSEITASLSIDASAFTSNVLKMMSNDFNGDDTIVGGSGADTIRPGGGTDSMTGNGGNDNFVGSASQLSGDTITDLGAGDMITILDVLGLSNANVRFNGTSTLEVDTDATDFNSAELTLSLTNAPGDDLAFTVTESGPNTLIKFTSENTAPVFSSLNGGATFRKNSNAVVIDSDVTIADAELDALNSNAGDYNNASLTISRSGGAIAQDIFSNSGLLGALSEGNAFTYNSVSVGTVTTNSAGTLKLTFNSSANSIITDSVVQAITYANNSNESPSTRVLNYTFNDGLLDSVGANQATVIVLAEIIDDDDENEAPTNISLSNSSISESAVGGVDVGLLSTTDVDSNSHTYSLVASTASATGSCSASTGNSFFQINGSTLETKAALLAGTYTVCVQTDDGAATFKKSFDITVTAATTNKPEISGTAATKVNQGELYSFTPTASDPQNRTLTFSITNKPSWASFNTTTGNLFGTPSLSNVGIYSSIIIAVSNGSEQTSMVPFDIEVVSENRAPFAPNLNLALDEDSNISFSPDITGANLISVVSQPQFGTLTQQANTFTYTPNANYFGEDSFTYLASDGVKQSAVATVSLTVASINDLPTANPDVFVFDENEQNTYTLDILANDTDADGELLTIIAAKASIGSVTIENGVLVYITQARIQGTIIIDYIIEDPKKARSQSTATLTINAVTSDMPVIELPADVNVNATALFTKVNLGVAQAFDSQGNRLGVSLVDSDTLFKPGNHLVYWKAVDSNGREAVATQTIRVNPLISLSKNAQISEDQTYTFSVFLNGQSPIYPVIIPYSVGGTASSADHDLVSGEVIIEQGRQGEVSFNVFADSQSENNETIIISLADTLNLGPRRTTTFTLVDGNIAPRITTTVKQGEQVRTLVSSDGEAVTITAVADDVNPNDSVSLSWESTSSELVNTSSKNDVFSFSTASLTQGIYKVTVTAKDDGTPSLSTSKDVYIEVVATLPVLTEQDSNGNLIPDDREGYGDSNNNGIPDYLDAINECNVMQEQVKDRTQFLVEGEPGICLRKGVTVTQNETGGVQLLDSELPADDTAQNVGGIFDFIATGLPNAGDTYSIVLPQRKPISQNAVYRKLIDGQWRNFVTAGDNKIQSAAGEPGFCPPPMSDVWQDGLVEGAWCVQLQIVDGGPNDDDGEANRTVVDPGGVAFVRSSNQVPQANPDEVTVGAGQMVTINVLDNDTDGDGDALSLTGATVDFGQVNIVDEQLQYTPPAEFIGVATIEYSITDGQGGTSNSQVKVNLVINNAPTAVFDTASTTDQASIDINVLANDTDIDGDTLFIIDAHAIYGTATINLNGTINYMPKLGFEGVDTIEYSIKDSKGAKSVGQVEVTVQAVKSVAINNESSGGGMGGVGLLLITALVIGRRKSLFPSFAIITATCLISSQATADTWHIEGMLGQAKADARLAKTTGNVQQVSVDDTGTSWSVGGYYDLTSNWQIGVRYIDLGQGRLSYTAETIAPNTVQMDVSRQVPVLPKGISTEVGYRLELLPLINSTLFLGAYRYDYTIKSRMNNGDVLTYEQHDTKAYIGASVGYSVYKNAELILKYTHYKLSENDVNSLSMGIKVHL